MQHNATKYSGIFVITVMHCIYINKLCKISLCMIGFETFVFFGVSLMTMKDVSTPLCLLSDTRNLNSAEKHAPLLRGNMAVFYHSHHQIPLYRLLMVIVCSSCCRIYHNEAQNDEIRSFRWPALHT